MPRGVLIELVVLVAVLGLWAVGRPEQRGIPRNEWGAIWTAAFVTMLIGTEIAVCYW